MQDRKNIVFRVDAASHIGTGHLQRCLTLAKELRNLKYNIRFIMSPFDRVFIDLVESENFKVLLLTEIDSNNIDISDSRQWLGKSQVADANECISLLNDMEIFCFIVDHYSIDIEWETIIKTKVSSIVVIDDLANRLHTCNLLLDQNYWSNYLTRYNGIVDESCIKLLGPNYCLLRDEFRTLRNEVFAEKAVNTEKILINFGGVGDYDLLSKFFSVLPYFTEKYEFIVVTGKLDQQKLNMLRDSSNSSKIIIMETTKNMAELMLESSYAFGACGSTVWERFCLGLNSSLIEVASNQRELLKFLSDKDLVHCLGDSISVSNKTIYNFINDLELHLPIYKDRKQKMMSLVDGNGVKRVAQKIKGLENV